MPVSLRDRLQTAKGTIDLRFCDRTKLNIGFCVGGTIPKNWTVENNKTTASNQRMKCGSQRSVCLHEIRVSCTNMSGCAITAIIIDVAPSRGNRSDAVLRQVSCVLATCPQRGKGPVWKNMTSASTLKLRLKLSSDRRLQLQSAGNTPLLPTRRQRYGSVCCTPVIIIGCRGHSCSSRALRSCWLCAAILRLQPTRRCAYYLTVVNSCRSKALGGVPGHEHCSKRERGGFKHLRPVHGLHLPLLRSSHACRARVAASLAGMPLKGSRC